MREICVEFTNASLALKYAKYGLFCKSLTLCDLQIRPLLDPRKKPIFAINCSYIYY